MKSPLAWVLIVAAVAGLLAVAALTMRYEFMPVRGQSGLWRHDRFTGETVYCRPKRESDGTVTANCPQKKEAPLDFSKFAVEPPSDPYARFPKATTTPFEEKPAPPNGQAWFCTVGPCRPLSQQSSLLAPFEIKSTAGQNYLVKLASTTTEHILIFVNGGSPVTVEVPLGTYTVTYATGPGWYGYRADNKFFGLDTAYSKADRTFQFSADESQIHGVSVTLYRVPSGNLRTHSISAAEF